MNARRFHPPGVPPPETRRVEAAGFEVSDG